MNKKLRLEFVKGGAIYWLVLLILASWTMMYLYFVSSSQVPIVVPEYQRELEAKEQALRRDLMEANHNAAKSARTYQLLSRNEICLHQFAAATEHQQTALLRAQNKLLTDGKDLELTYLENANLNREMGQYDLAKINYEHSLHCLSQRAFGSDFSRNSFNTAAISLNNLGIFYFVMGQQTTDIDQRQKYFQLAKDYFIRVKNLIFIAGSSHSGCFQKNVEENLKQCLNEIKFSHSPQ